MTNHRFTLIFAFPESLQVAIAQLSQTLVSLTNENLTGFTVWPSLGWADGYGIERGATVEFIATLPGAVHFAAAVSDRYLQDCVYLASGDGAVLIDPDGTVIEILAPGSIFGGTLTRSYSCACDGAEFPEVDSCQRCDSWYAKKRKITPNI